MWFRRRRRRWICEWLGVVVGREILRLLAIHDRRGPWGGRKVDRVGGSCRCASP